MISCGHLLFLFPNSGKTEMQMNLKKSIVTSRHISIKSELGMYLCNLKTLNDPLQWQSGQGNE